MILLFDLKKALLEKTNGCQYNTIYIFGEIEIFRENFAAILSFLAC
jgi:hypothetical protein